MKNSDVIKTLFLSTINEIAADPSKYAVNPGRDFTRNRKLGFHNILLMLLTMEADCIKEELYRFFGRSTDAPSKAAFYKQRRKLTVDALANFQRNSITENTSSLRVMVPPLISFATLTIPTPSLSLTANPQGDSTRSISMFHLKLTGIEYFHATRCHKYILSC